MKTEISRRSFDELKHFLSVNQQMGRVQLDADANEQSELLLRLWQRLGSDVIKTGSPNDGFRIDTHLLLDSLDRHDGWQTGPGEPEPTVDYMAAEVGVGRIHVSGATELGRALAQTIDLSGATEVLFGAEGTFADTEIQLFVSAGGSREALPTTKISAPFNQGRVFRADLTGISIDLSLIDGYGFLLDALRTYNLDWIKADVPIRTTLVRSDDLDAVTPGPSSATKRVQDDERFDRSLILRLSGASRVSFALPVPRTSDHFSEITVVVRRVGGGAPAYHLWLDDAATGGTDKELTASSTATAGGWHVRTFKVDQSLDVEAVRLEGLDPAETYEFGPLRATMRGAQNLVIMGGDGTAAGAGRFYGDGLAAMKESHETYLSQDDLPLPDETGLAAPPEGFERADLVYLDLWERPITYIEDPSIAEIALEGPDTCTRTKLVAQVRILPGTEVELPASAVPPEEDFADLLECGRGRLTTREEVAKLLDPCADPCEPKVAGTFVGEYNRLFRVEVSKGGAVGAAGDPGTAKILWSRENGAVATPIEEVLAAGATSASVGSAEGFEIGDLIRIEDDLSDLGAGPYSDRSVPRGELRTITSIDLTGDHERIAWTAPLTNAYHRALRPRIRKWDGELEATPGVLALSKLGAGEDVFVELGGSDLLPGDYWQFVTRVATRSVERLVEAPPGGECHRYYKLGIVHRRTEAGVESVWVEDSRPRFSATTALPATEIEFDAKTCETHDPVWGDVRNVQQAIDTLCRVDRDTDMKKHHRLLHGYGVICGLKVRCHPTRTSVTIEAGHALDCEGAAIDVDEEFAFPIVDAALEAGLIPGGSGEISLVLRRGPGGAPEVLVEDGPGSVGFWTAVLEGTLLKDFWDHCIMNLWQFLVNSFSPFPATTVPVPDSHKRLMCLINLFFQLINPATASYVFLSKKEHDLLEDFYQQLKALLTSETFCAMWDSATPFPAYPTDFSSPQAIDTAIGLWRFHLKVRIHPDGAHAYSCGTGKYIQVYDLETAEVIEELEFPGQPSTQVQDVAFSEDGTKLYVIGVVAGKDSALGTATIDFDNGHSWDKSDIVCDCNLVRLATAAGAPGRLFAVGLEKGLYEMDPTASPVVPTLLFGTNTTGQLIEGGGGRLYFSSYEAGPGTSQFDTIHCWDLHAGHLWQSSVSGVDSSNAMVEHESRLYATGSPDAGHTGGSLYQLDIGTGAVLTTTDLVSSSRYRLAAVPAQGPRPAYLLVSYFTQNKLKRVQIDGGAPALDNQFRVPVQIWPVEVVGTADGARVVALHMLGTMSVIDVDAIFDPTRTYNTEPPPDPVAAYRQQMIDAFLDLLDGFFQYLKDCFCDLYLIDCPTCTEEDKVYLGVVEIQNGKVYNICNFDRRRYVKSFRTYGYWLSTVPVLPILKRALAELCCAVVM